MGKNVVLPMLTKSDRSDFATDPSVDVKKSILCFDAALLYFLRTSHIVNMLQFSKCHALPECTIQRFQLTGKKLNFNL
jgi:hypothetical protein